MKWIEQNEAGGSRKRAAQEVLHATQGGNPSVSLIAESVNVVKDGTAGTAGTHGKIWVRHVAGEVPCRKPLAMQRCSECGEILMGLYKNEISPYAPGTLVYVRASKHSSGLPMTEVTDEHPQSRFVVPCFNGAKAWGAGTHLPWVYRLAFYRPGRKEAA